MDSEAITKLQLFLEQIRRPSHIVRELSLLFVVNHTAGKEFGTQRSLALEFIFDDSLKLSLILLRVELLLGPSASSRPGS